MKARPTLQTGFTLVEVVVALAVVAITLAAGWRAIGSLTLSTERQWQALAAQICADNALGQWRLRKQLPDVGETSEVCMQGPLALRVEQVVQPTPNPNFRRVEATVLTGDEPRVRLLRVQTVVGAE